MQENGESAMDQRDAIADSLNMRPRAADHWLSPLRVYAAVLASTYQPSTSVH